jgi:Arc/MetJ-type ribon-helix-helix transcriptional regulator
MTIQLKPEQEHIIEEAIRFGRFRSVDEFISTAISSVSPMAADEPSTAPRKSRIWELRQGLSLGDLSIKELIEEGRE